MSASFLHDAKALEPMLVTPFGIVTFVSELHPENEYVPMLFSVLGS